MATGPKCTTVRGLVLNYVKKGLRSHFDKWFTILQQAVPKVTDSLTSSKTTVVLGTGVQCYNRNH